MHLQSLHLALGYYHNQISTFPEFVAAGEKVERTRMLLRQNEIMSFINSIPKKLSWLQKNGMAISDADWRKFERSFVRLTENQMNKEPLRELVYTIENITGRHLEKIDDALISVRLLGPKKKVALVPRKSLDSFVFHNMFVLPFQESRNREIKLCHLPPECFDFFVSVLNKKPIKISLQHMLEPLKMAHAFSDVNLFNEILSQLFLVVDSPMQPWSVDSRKIEEIFSYLRAMLGLKYTSINTYHQERDIDWKAIVTQHRLEEFYNHMQPKDNLARNKLLEVLCGIGACFVSPCNYLLKDIEAAWKIFRFCEKLDSPQAWAMVGLFYEKKLSSRNEVANFRRALAYYKRAAEAKNGEGCYNLGRCIQDGLYPTPGIKKAVEYYRIAAEQGHTAAQIRLGVCYEQAIGVYGDFKKAKELFTAAVENGNVEANYYLGHLYANPETGFYDIQKAVKYLTIAADHRYMCSSSDHSSAYYVPGLGCRKARDELAGYFVDGIVVQKDLKSALEHYNSIDDWKGCCEAMFKFSKFYATGDGVEQDLKLSIEILKLAAECGYMKARDDLANRYEKGDGVPKDLTTAEHYRKYISWEISLFSWAHLHRDKIYACQHMLSEKQRGWGCAIS